MTQYGAPFDGILLGDASVAPYSATEWARLWQLRHGVGTSFPNYGVFKGTGDGTYEPLALTATSGANVEVKPGAALVHGRFYESTVGETLAVAANASGNPRIDTVILRTDFVAQTIRLVVKQGTPAGSPVAPALQQDATYWEMPLGNIAVANGFSTFGQGDFTDRRRAVHASAAGWQPYAYPINHAIGGNYGLDSLNLANDSTVAVPIVVTGSLLVNSLTFRNLATTTITPTWALYIEDTNDGLTAENTLRRIATTANGNTAVTANTNVTLAAATPFLLSPGAYWLVVKNANAGAMQIGRLVVAGFDTGLNSYQTHANPTIAQTLDFVTSWSKGAGSLALRLNGRVFGQAASF